MKKILSIALNTFKEAIRDKILYNLILFALLLIASSLVLGMISINIETKVILDVGLSAMSIMGAMIAIFIGIQLVHKEIDKRTLYSLLSKPVTRAEFVLGKFSGLALTLLVNLIIMAIGLVLALVSVTKSLSALPSSLGPALVLIYGELLLITALALLFSSFSTPTLSALFTFALYFIGHFNNDIRHFGLQAKSVWVGWVTTALSYGLPNFGNFNVIAGVSHGKPIELSFFGVALLYGAVYISLLLAVAVAIFQHRNLK